MNKYFRAIYSNLFFFVINSVFFLLITPISIHLMGYEFFGLWSILNSIILLSNIGSLGIESIVNKFAAEEKIDQDQKKYVNEVLTAGGLIILIMSIIVGCILVILRNFISTNIHISSQYQPQFSIAIIFLAITIFPQFLSSVIKGFLLSRLKNQTVRVVDTFFSVSIWSGAVLIVMLIGRNISIVALWGLLNCIIYLLIYLVILKKTFPVNILINRYIVYRMLRFSGYMFIESIAIALFTQGDRIVVGFVLGPAIAGVYSVGTSISLRISMIAGQITSVMLPFASQKHSIHEHEYLFRIFCKLSKYITLIIMGCAGVLILWMDKFLEFWISPDYSAMYSNIFRILIIAYSISSLSLPAHQTLTGLGKVKFTSLVYLGASLLTLIGIALFAHFYGLNGAAWANCLLFTLYAFNLFVYHNLKHNIKWTSILRDLSLALFVPVSLFTIMNNNQSILLKFFISSVLVVLIVIVVIKDNWARAWFWQQVKYVKQKYI